MYPDGFIILWNAAVRLIFLSVFSFILSKLIISQEREKMRARTDFLTRIANIQAFMEYTTEEIQRSRRYQRCFTIVYMDCDQFKSINDTLGHNEGNRLLKDIAKTIQKALRSMDKVGRLGGDEFLILLPETDGEKAKNTVARLQEELSSTLKAHNWDVTFSLGVATFSTVFDNASNMISKADHLMRQAKKEGKNQAVFQTFYELSSPSVNN